MVKISNTEMNKFFNFFVYPEGLSENPPSIFMAENPETAKDPSVPEQSSETFNPSKLIEVVKNWLNPTSTAEESLSPMQEKYKNYLDNNMIQKPYQRGLAESILPDTGNGSLDKPVKQVAGICVTCAGINSLKSTEQGKKILQTHLYKDEGKQIFAIHLKEAENNHMPEPDGNGIYTFTLQEVLNIQNSETGMLTGEGDAAAYVLAIEQYLKECNIKETGNDTLPKGKKFFAEGLSNERFYEIIDGTKLNMNSDAMFKKGISGANLNQKSSESNNDYENRLSLYFDNICNIANKGIGSTTLVQGITYDSNDENSEQSGKHAYSVVGTATNAEGKLCILIQDSNHPAKLLIRDEETGEVKSEIKKHNNEFPPTFELTKEQFKEFVTSFATYVYE